MSRNGASRRVFRGLRLVGGHPALDLVNTVKYRGRAQPVDSLSSFIDAVDWAEIASLVDTREAIFLRVYATDNPRDAARQLQRITGLREQLRCILDPSNGYALETRAAAGGAITARIARLKPVLRVDLEKTRLVSCFPIDVPGALADRLAQSAADLLTCAPRPPIVRCDGSDCDWLFLDRSKARRRRWCDSEICGNLSRVRRFRSEHANSDNAGST